jgi:hypothetical protein
MLNSWVTGASGFTDLNELVVGMNSDTKWLDRWRVWCAKCESHGSPHLVLQNIVGEISYKASLHPAFDVCLI